MGGLERLFRPRSIAVIGASADAESIPGRLLHNLVRSFSGPIYAVNPHRRVVQGLHSYSSVGEISEPIDLAFVTTPTDAVLASAKACAEKGVPVLAVISAGFSEVGSAGRVRQRELLAIARRSGMRVLGPNCFGILNTDPNARLTGVFTEMAPRPGRVAVGSESGALGIIVPEQLQRLGLGVSTFASIGNKADIDETDLLEYWENDPGAACVLLYLESFKRPSRFRETASRVSRSKPVVVLKAGRTESSQRAAGSHTAAMAGSESATQALIAQSGVIRSETLEEFFNAAQTLSGGPRPAGPRCAVLTNAGGPGVVCVDALEQRGLQAPEFSDALQHRLRAFCPTYGSVVNPVDLVASVDPELHRRCLAEILEAGEVDAAIVIFVPRVKETAGPVAKAIRETAGVDKPVLAVFMQPDAPRSELSRARSSIPCFEYPEQAASALAAAFEQRTHASRPPESFPAIGGIDLGRASLALGVSPGWLPPERVAEVLDAFDLKQPASRLARTPEDAVAAARSLQCPVAVKVVASSALHKWRAGGVALDVSGDDAVREAFRSVTAAAADAEGALIQAFVPGGREALVGVSRDPVYGRLIAFGSGGTEAEAEADVAFRLAPLSDVDVREMVAATRIGKKLQSTVDAPASRESLYDLLLRLSAMAQRFPEIAELDFNPVKILEDRLLIVDARIHVRPLRQSLGEPSLAKPLSE